MNLRSVIIDDEVRNRETLLKMLSTFCPQVENLGMAASVKEGIDLVESVHPNLVFLDIEMPGGNGFELLEHFSSPDFEVIFTTAHDLYAINAIKFAALDYLMKPLNIRELKDAVSRAEKKINLSSPNDEQYSVLKSNLEEKNPNFKKIAMPTSEGIDFVEVNDIISAHADRSYAHFQLVNQRKMMVSKPLKEYAELLEQCDFYRVHKSSMVNLSHVKKYVKGKGGYLIMSDGSHVDVSVRRKEDLLKTLTQMHS